MLWDIAHIYYNNILNQMSNTIKICILTSAHPYDDVRVYRKIALSLKNEFEVDWIGPETYYFENDLGDDQINRILIRPRKGIAGRVVISFRVLGKLRKMKREYDFLYFPDPDIALIYAIFYRNRNEKSIFDIHEVFHEDLLKRKVNATLGNILKKFTQRLIRYIVKRVTITTGVSRTVLNYYVDEGTRFIAIRNCLPKDFIKDGATIIRKNHVFTVIHGKNHPSRGTMSVLESIKILKNRGLEFSVLMIDTRSESVNEYVRHERLEKYIDLRTGLPFTAMLSEIKKSHAGLIAYAKDLGVDSLPNRIFEYMAMEIPVVVPGFSEEMANIVKKENCGLVVNTENPEEIANAFEYLMKNRNEAEEMGRRGKSAFLERHNWEIEIEPLIRFIRNNPI